MATKNDITGDSLISKTNTDAYRSNYDLIFRNKNVSKDDKKSTEEAVKPVEESRSQE